MQDIMRSLKENAISRLKNPIIGAFVLSWTILNLNGLSLFLLVDTQAKIEIVKNKNWMLTDDFLYPLGMALLYLFALPLLNMGHELINDGLINYHRIKNKNDTNKKIAIQKKETVIAEIESGISYLQKLKDKEIDRWIEERGIRNAEFIAQKERYSKLIAESTSSRRAFLTDISKTTKEKNELEAQKTILEKSQQENRATVERTTNQIENALKNIENNGGSFSSSDINTIRKLVSSMRVELSIWDDDVPF